jgi:ABC-type branched-subunit amino acid transport system substrate-binding protein
MTIEANLIDPLEAMLLPRGYEVLRMGLVVPQSGALGMVGPSALDAALLAAHELNVRGGVNGRYVDLVLVDGGGAPDGVAHEVDQLCRAGALDAITGFHTSDVHRAIEAVVAGHTPYVFTPPHEGGRRRQGVVCIGTDPGHQLRGSIDRLAIRHRLHNWAMVGNDYIWPRAMHHVARRLIARTNGRVVMERLVGLGHVTAVMDRLIDDLRRSNAQGLLLSLVGRDLATFNTALKHSGLDRRLVRLSGALEENGLLAFGGDQTGTLYASMPSFASQTSERRLSLDARYQSLFGSEAPVLDTYAEGVYDGVHLVAALAAEGSLSPHSLVSAAARLIGDDVTRRVTGSEEGSPNAVHLARAEGLEFAVVS